jgi:hypothetical protein
MKKVVLPFVLLAVLLSPNALRLCYASDPLEVSPEATRVMNQELSKLWSRMAPILKDTVEQELKGLSGQKKGKLTIRRIDSIRVNTLNPPEILFGSTGSGAGGGSAKSQAFSLRIPGSRKGWSIKFRARLKYRFEKKILFFKVKKTIKMKLEVKVRRIRLTETIEVDTTNPENPAIKKVHNPKLNYKLSLSSSNFIANIALALAKPFVDRAIKKMLTQAIAKIEPTLKGLKGRPGTPHGLGGPALSISSSTPDFLSPALKISQKIQANHLPWNTLVIARFDNPNPGQGRVVSHEGFGDSAIWTGHYLAAEGFRFAATGDPQALANAKRAISGIKDLLDICGNEGLLARAVIPCSSPVGQAYASTRTQKVFRGKLRGQDYFGVEHISRDQYTGVMMGLAVAYDTLTDPQTKREIKGLITRILDYLLKNDWIAMRINGRDISAPFQSTPHHQLAYLNIGKRVDPQKFTPALKSHHGLSSMVWFPIWSSTFDPHGGYYKFNLAHGCLYNLLRLESDPARWRDCYEAFRILRKAIGHHQNAWFNLVEISNTPSSRVNLDPETRELLRRWLMRPTRRMPVKNSNDPNLQKIKYDKLIPKVHYYGSNNVTTTTFKPEWIALYPLSVEKRPTTGYFLWQRSPFKLDGGGDPRAEPPGIDYILPYWMARYYGVIR